MFGYTGKILRLNLTDRTFSTIDTEKYVEWGGGHGMGSAIFWDLCEDKTIDGFDPKNVITMMTSPLNGTMAPSASSRVEIQGIGVQSYPVGWFTRSNFGGRFAGQLKYAGWDGIVIEGAADAPVMVEIVNDKVTFKDAADLWGKDTWATQQAIWAKGSEGEHGWANVGTARDAGRTTAKPAILTIGPAGENLSVLGALIHDAGNAAGQGGFGAIFGAKKLKAISVLGTGSVTVADPVALMNSRLWAKDEYASQPGTVAEYNGASFGVNPAPTLLYKKPPVAEKGPQSCQGCIAGCRARFADGVGNESSCQETAMYGWADVIAHGEGTQASVIAADYVQKMGINSYDMMRGLMYFYALSKMGVLGAGKEIECDWDFSKLGEAEFAIHAMDQVAKAQGIGAELKGGFVRFAEKRGRLAADFKSGILNYPYWGLPNHGYDPRAELEWGYGSMVGDRDINEHGFNANAWSVVRHKATGLPMPTTAEEYAKITTSKMVPYQGDMDMVDFSTPNMYSESMAKLVVWQRHYTRFWKQSALYCDFRWPDFTNYNRDDNVGLTGDGEPRFWNDVTGDDMTFEEGIELGRKIWNLDNAIWTLQGRHRDMVQFADFIYDVPLGNDSSFGPFYPLAGKKEDGTWDYINTVGRAVSREGWEQWKDHFYTLEGWDLASGWPTRATLGDLGLDHVADALASAGKLGGE